MFLTKKGLPVLVTNKVSSLVLGRSFKYSSMALMAASVRGTDRPS